MVVVFASMDWTMAFYLEHRRSTPKNCDQKQEEVDPLELIISCMTCDVCLPTSSQPKIDPIGASQAQQAPYPVSPMASYVSPVAHQDRVVPSKHDIYLEEYPVVRHSSLRPDFPVDTYLPATARHFSIPENEHLQSRGDTGRAIPSRAKSYAYVQPRSILFGPNSPRHRSSGNNVKWRDVESFKAANPCFTLSGANGRSLEEIIDSEAAMPNFDPIEQAHYGTVEDTRYVSRSAIVEDQEDDPILCFREKKLSSKRQHHRSSRTSIVPIGRDRKTSTTRQDDVRGQAWSRRTPPLQPKQDKPKGRRGMFFRKERQQRKEDSQYAEIIWKSKGPDTSRRGSSDRRHRGTGNKSAQQRSRKSYEHRTLSEYTQYAEEARDVMDDFDSSIIADSVTDWV